jgi:hypothetical protein
MVKLAAAGFSCLGGVGGIGGKEEVDGWAGMWEAEDCGRVPIGAWVGERVFDGKSRTSSWPSSLIRFALDVCCIEGRRDPRRDQDVVLVLLTLQSTPRGLARAPKASTFQPNRVWLSVEGRGNAMPSPEFVEP